MTNRLRDIEWRPFLVVALLFGLLATTACSEASDETGWQFTAPGTSPSGPPTDGALVGLWLVRDGQAHATDLMTLYDFRETGELIEIETKAFGRPPSPKGRVGRCGENDLPERPICEFDGRWRINDDGRLVIEGQCTDGDERDIVLAYDTNPSDGSELSISIESVGGESDWCPPRWGWRWERCETSACID